jgi:hypothetical protein
MGSEERFCVCFLPGNILELFCPVECELKLDTLQVVLVTWYANIGISSGFRQVLGAAYHNNFSAS